MTQQQNPQYRVSGPLRSRVNTLGHQAGQRYGLQRRDELVRLLEAQGRAGLDANELAQYLDGLEQATPP